jgi:hypothetical protein
MLGTQLGAASLRSEQPPCRASSQGPSRRIPLSAGSSGKEPCKLA